MENLKFFILDEADRMLDMGFEGDIRQLVSMGMPSKEQRQTLMFSATFPQQIQLLAKEFLNNYVFIAVGTVGGANCDITQVIHEISKYDKRDKLTEILKSSGKYRCVQSEILEEVLNVVYPLP